jgi:hypothetical protein
MNLLHVVKWEVDKRRAYLKALRTREVDSETKLLV